MIMAAVTMEWSQIFFKDGVFICGGGGGDQKTTTRYVLSFSFIINLIPVLT